MAITIGVKWIYESDAHNEYCGRGSVFGNPYPMQNKSIHERNRVCDMYEEYFKKEANRAGSDLRNGMLRLLAIHKAGININLQCFCPGVRCHCETIKHSLEKASNK